MIAQQNKIIVTRFNKDVIEGKKLDVFYEIMDEDFVNHSVLPGLDPGPGGMLHFLKNILWPAFSGIKITIHEQVAEDDKVVTRKTIHGTHVGEFLKLPASQKHIDIEVIDIVRLKNGKYIEHWRSWDPQNVIMQINA
jgi:predicted SnoaL-like aldol condensation-catalyzing enzyme